jgi:hypothetical protein
VKKYAISPIQIATYLDARMNSPEMPQRQRDELIKFTANKTRGNETPVPVLLKT